MQLDKLKSSRILTIGEEDHELVVFVLFQIVKLQVFETREDDVLGIEQPLLTSKVNTNQFSTN